MNDSTLLHRQVHPSWIQQGQITSQVFRPSPKDENLLSTYDGDQISAEGAWIHFTQTLGFKSIGVVAVSVGECQKQELRAFPDKDHFLEHVVIDFSGLSEKAIIKKAKRLKEVALVRGWQFQSES